MCKIVIEVAICIAQSVVLCDTLEVCNGGEAGREAQERRDICTYIADSSCCMAETNTIL